MRAAATLALLGALALGVRAEPPAEPKAPAGFGWFGELAGSCWTGERTGGRTKETHCFAVMHERLIRGAIRATTRLADGSEQVFQGEGIFAYEPTGNRVLYTQWSSTGSYGTGEFTFEGDTLVFVNRKADGTPAPTRSVWRRTGPDGYRVVRERRDGSEWKEYLAVHYRRVP